MLLRWAPSLVVRPLIKRLLAVSLLSCVIVNGDVLRAATEAMPGERVFQRQCSGCHSLEPGEHVAGPSLYGVVGRRAGKLEGYDFSAQLEAATRVWTVEKLDRFLSDPSEMFPDTRMVFWGLRPEQRRQVIEYLEAVAQDDG